MTSHPIRNSLKTETSGRPSMSSMAFLQFLLISLGTAGAAGAADELIVPADPAAATSHPQIDCHVVSTRRCPQEGHCLCGPEQYDYHQIDPAGQWQSSDLDGFLQSLTPTDPVCFFVHGNLVTWQEAFQEGLQAASAMQAVAPAGSRLTFVMLTWQSDRVFLLPGVDVEIKAKRADTTGFYLAQLVRRLPPDQKVCLVGHSHGARAVAGTLQLLGGGVVASRALPDEPATESPPRLRAVFLAGTLDHNSLEPGKTYDRVLTTAESVLNVRNSRDAILALYPLRLPFSESAIGRVGLKDREWSRLGSGQSRIQQIDVGHIIGSEHDWMAYFHHPVIATSLTPWVFFLE
ncbi:alpha/beta hydrolase [bacterium]|nr:alpha/beta hydrolase [bacterium]